MLKYAFLKLVVEFVQMYIDRILDGNLNEVKLRSIGMHLVRHYTGRYLHIHMHMDESSYMTALYTHFI